MGTHLGWLVGSLCMAPSRATIQKWRMAVILEFLLQQKTARRGFRLSHHLGLCVSCPLLPQRSAAPFVLPTNQRKAARSLHRDVFLFLWGGHWGNGGLRGGIPHNSIRPRPHMDFVCLCVRAIGWLFVVFVFVRFFVRSVCVCSMWFDPSYVTRGDCHIIVHVLPGVG